MKGKLLLFGFEDLFSAPAIISAVEPLGLEVVPRAAGGLWPEAGRAGRV